MKKVFVADGIKFKPFNVSAILPIAPKTKL